MGETLTVIGSSGRTVEITSDSALSARPKSDYLKAVEDGYAFSWSALTYDMTAKDTILGVENNSATMNLHIQEIHIQSDTATQFVVHTETGITMAGTNAITGVNLNRSSGRAITGLATAYDDETGNTAADGYTKRLYTGLCAADGNVVIEVGGAVILPNDHMIGVDLTANAAACNVTILGYFKTR
jgi:hypothetical protein